MYELQSEVMSRAGELRSEGLDPSEALSEAWSEVGSNPAGAKFAPSLLTLALIGGAILVGLWRWKKGTWPWQPTAVSSRLLMRRNNPGHNPGTYREKSWGEPGFLCGSSPPVLTVKEPITPSVVGGGISGYTSEIAMKGYKIISPSQPRQPMYGSECYEPIGIIEV